MEKSMRAKLLIILAAAMAGTRCFAEVVPKSTTMDAAAAAFRAWGEDTKALVKGDFRMPDSGGPYPKGWDRAASASPADGNHLLFAANARASLRDSTPQPESEEPEQLARVTYRGIRPTDPDGRMGLRNPERGFRTETLIAEPLGRTEGVWVGIPAHMSGRVGPGYNPGNWVHDIRRFDADGLALVQAYCYLTSYHDQPLPEDKLNLLQEAFDTMRATGAKCVLRFAYIRDYPPDPPAPGLDRVLQHMDQLKPILWKNADVIHVLEAGFLAAWGEWHINNHLTENHERSAVLEKLLSLVPEDIFIQVRYPGAKTSLLPILTGQPYAELTEAEAMLGSPAARIGYHDDGVLTAPKGMRGYVFAREPVEFGDLRALVKNETLFVPMGGELFWTDMRWYGEGAYYSVTDGLETARFLRDYHFNVLSLAHSYSEREGKPLSIDHWRSRAITEDQLREFQLPMARDWFVDILGNPVTRTQFEYIRDHLGYRIELQEAAFTPEVSRGGAMRIEVSLINRGFSTLFHGRPVTFALIGADGSVHPFPAAEVDVRKWYPHRPNDRTYAPLVHTVAFQAALPEDLPPGHYSLGLWLPDKSERLRMNPAYAIRVANGDVPFWRSIGGQYGINLLGVVHVLP